MQTKWMELALLEAKKAQIKNEVPVGAVIVFNDQPIASSHNQTISQKNACAHAEILCIVEACKLLGNHRLNHTEIYITLEPCIMCYGAIAQARIPKVYFGAYDKRTGVFSTEKLSSYLNINHHPQHQGGVLDSESISLLTTFFQDKR